MVPVGIRPAKPLAPVSVVIPTLGRHADLLAASLPSLLDDPATLEVLVVLSAGAFDIARVEQLAHRHNGVSLLTPGDFSLIGDPNPEQGARDAGAHNAVGEVILALDDDVAPSAGLVSGHARRHRDESGLVVLGYMPVVDTNSPNGSSGASRLYAESYEQACREYRADPEAVLRGLWGGNFSVGKTAWLQAAAMPSVVKAGYHPDQELGLKFQRIGLKGVFDSELRADHHYNRSVRELLANARSAGANQVRLRRAYPDLLAPVPPTERGISGFLTQLARSGFAAWLLERSFFGLAWIAGFLGLSRLEMDAARAIRRLGWAQGALEAD